MEEASFSWEGTEPLLYDINLRIGIGQLVAIVGSVGSGNQIFTFPKSTQENQFFVLVSGKSSLLSAFLGEMDRLSGRVNTVGRIAYVSETRRNIKVTNRGR